MVLFMNNCKAAQSSLLGLATLAFLSFFTINAANATSLNTAIKQKETLPANVNAALKRFKLNGKGLSVFVQEIGAEQPIIAHQSNIARNPGSAIKLLTTYAAMEVLSPSYRWHTDFFADGDIVNKTLNGDLWVKGGGDPYLPLQRLWLLVHQLRNKGLQTINGDLVIDQSLFTHIDEDPAAFDNQGLRAYNVVPAPLVSNFNVSQFIFRPNGKKVDVEVIPNIPTIKIDNRLRVASKSCSGYQRGIAMSVNDQGAVVLDGKFPKRCRSYAMARSVLDKNEYTAELFRKFWQESGGRWDGKLRVTNKGNTEKEFDGRPFFRFNSVELADAVRSINKYSNNLMTRMLFLSLGMEQFDAPGNADKSRRAIDDWLEQKNLDFPQLHVHNGAGSSRNTRITAENLGSLLLTAWQSPYMPELIASMSLSGQNGTFAKRHMTSVLNGRAHLKSGRLDHVVAMAGFLQAKDDRRYVVVTLHNATDAHRGSGQAIQDALLGWLFNR